MFPSIDVSGLEAVFEILENREKDFPPAAFFWKTLSYVWKATTLYSLRNFIYRKMLPLWNNIFRVLIVILVSIGLPWRPCVIHLRSCIGKSLISRYLCRMKSLFDTSDRIKFTMSITNNDSALEFWFKLSCKQTSEDLCWCICQTYQQFQI